MYLDFVMDWRLLRNKDSSANGLPSANWSLGRCRQILGMRVLTLEASAGPEGPIPRVVGHSVRKLRNA